MTKLGTGLAQFEDLLAMMPYPAVIVIVIVDQWGRLMDNEIGQHLGTWLMRYSQQHVW